MSDFYEYGAIFGGCYALSAIIACLVMIINSSAAGNQTLINMDNVEFEGMEQLIHDWETPFVTDIFVIPKEE